MKIKFVSVQYFYKSFSSNSRGRGNIFPPIEVTDLNVKSTLDMQKRKISPEQETWFGRAAETLRWHEGSTFSFLFLSGKFVFRL